MVSVQLVAEQQLNGVRERNIAQAQVIAEEIEIFLREVRTDLQMVREVIASGTTLQATHVNQFLTTVVHNSQFFESIYLLDEHHHVLELGVLPQLEIRQEDFADVDFSGHQLFRSAETIKGPVWSDTFVSLVTGEPSVTLCLPMSKGFLLGNIQLSSLNQLMKGYAQPGGVETAIIDKGGTLIAHSKSGLALQRINFGDHPTVYAAMNGKESTREFASAGRQLLESAMPIQDSRWVAWVGLDMSYVNAPIQKMRNILLFFMAVAAALASITSLFNVRRLMLPLTSLGQKASQIAEGHYEFQFQPSGFSEIDALGSQITQMSRAIKIREASIITNEQRFRSLVNSIDGIVWEMEYPSLRYLFVSQQAEPILGYPIEDWYEDRNFWVHKVHDADLEPSRSYCQMMADAHQDHAFEYRMVAADGRFVWIRNLVTVVVEGNRPVRLLGVMIDITTQKQLLEELRSSEENYREIFNGTSDAIFIHDADGRILDVNRAMLEMFNGSHEQALSADLGQLSLGSRPYSADDAQEKIRLALKYGHCSFEWIARKMTGETFWADVNLRSALIGQQLRVLASIRDISQRKATEEELERYRSTLEDLVTERSAQLELAQAELVQKERLAVLGQLTATVSHEIRNPLGTVANALFLIKESLKGEVKTTCDKPLLLAERNIARCDTIISDLLDFSRQRRIEKSAVRIDDWLQDLLDEIPLPQEVRLIKRLSAKGIVPADPERLRRVLVNVLTNALQALDEVERLEKRLTIETRMVEQKCLIVVRDNGSGMSPEVMSRIYEPMFSTKNFGVGLGVPIIKNILEGHCGGVEYQSEPGQGTVVTMWLPLTQDTCREAQ